MLKLEISGRFEKESPILKAWIDKKIQRAQEVPLKVERVNIPRGELYGFSQGKTLFALSQVVKPNVKFNLKNLADSLKVPYGTLRHWVNDERIKEKTSEFVEEFVDEFVTRLVWRLQAKMTFDTQGGPPPAPDETIDILMEEIRSFRGPILYCFIEKLSDMLRGDSEMRSLFRPFCNEVFDYVEPHNAVHFKQLYQLSNQLAVEEVNENFGTLAGYIKDKLGLEKLEDCKSDTLSYLNLLNEYSEKYWILKGHLDFLAKANKREFVRWQDQIRKQKLPRDLRQLDEKGKKDVAERQQLEIPQVENIMAMVVKARTQKKKIKIEL